MSNKKLKIFGVVGVAVIGMMVTWYYFANYINGHVDEVVAQLLEESAKNNSKYELEKLSYIKRLIDEGDIKKAKSEIDSLTELHKSFMEICESQKCRNQLSETISKPSS